MTPKNSEFGRREMLGDHVYSRLRASILAGEIAPGQRVTEVDIASRLEVSRTPVREALHRLESEHMLQRIGGALCVVSFDPIQAYETYLIRELVEPECAFYSAPHLTTLDLARMDACVEAMADSDSATEQAELNNEFHDVLLSACPYPRLLEVASTARDRMITYRLFHEYDPQSLRNSNREHRVIATTARSIVRGEADASDMRALIRDHIRGASAYITAPAPRSDAARKAHPYDTQTNNP